ncbi:hypothetical protein K6Y31_17590 [Motilimonas cestriensis]|uniref:Competence protein CoiA-like family protein n=1 Tax=Motilimonas cestriensis TaxID=2742685 RepID=A0ABS8WC50_9GAMM|nr:hypothetical protein [Motilimonas cestriensis]
MIVQSSSVQYAFALDKEGALIHISKAQRSNSYICPGCKSPLSPVLGDVNAKHYRHSEECCPLETYLHKTAKEALFLCYQHAIKTDIPITLELKRSVSCSDPRLGLLRNANQCSKSAPARYNLTQFFDLVDLEKVDKNTGMQPDVLLSESSGTRRCYIEVCVTHPCAQQKIDTGIPIIEFKVQSVDDIIMLSSGKYSVEDERLSVFNWLPPPRVDNKCSEPCSVGDMEISVWRLSDSGRLNEIIMPLSDVDLITDSVINAWPSSLGADDVANNLRSFLRHVDPQMLFSNCIMCDQADTWKSGYIRCQSKAKLVPYTEARQCAAYKVKEWQKD